MKIARLRYAADLLVAAEFWGESAKDKLERVRHAAVKSGHYVEKGPTEEFEQVAAKERRGQKMFHWPLEFPEVIVKRGGFDAFVGNPPFVGGSRITGIFGTHFRDYLKVSLRICIHSVFCQQATRFQIRCASSAFLSRILLFFSRRSTKRGLRNTVRQ